MARGLVETHDALTVYCSRCYNQLAHNGQFCNIKIPQDKSVVQSDYSSLIRVFVINKIICTACDNAIGFRIHSIATALKWQAVEGAFADGVYRLLQESEKAMVGRFYFNSREIAGSWAQGS